MITHTSDIHLNQTNHTNLMFPEISDFALFIKKNCTNTSAWKLKKAEENCVMHFTRAILVNQYFSILFDTIPQVFTCKNSEKKLSKPVTAYCEFGDYTF